MSKAENPNQGREIEIISIDQREIELLEKNRKINLQKLFTPEGMDLMIAEIQKEVADFSADISTKEGRAKIISMAAKVAKCKSPIKNLASELKEESRRLIDGVNAQWNRYESAMDTLRDEIRKPVDEIEEAEAQILAERKERIESIKNHGMLYNSTLHDIKIAIENVKKILDFDNWGEFQFIANNAAKEVLENLENLHKQKEEQIKRDQELEQLRAEAAERARKDHEEKIVREAAEKAKIDAEIKADIEKNRIIREKKDAEERAKEAERLAIEQAAQAELARIAAEKKAKEDAEKAAADAVRKEQERVAEEKRKEEEAAEKREANKKHRTKIHCEASASLVKVLESLNFPDAEILIEAIAKGEVPYVQINY